MRSFFLAAVLACTFSAAARAEEARLVLLHTTDLHGSLTAWDYLADVPAARGLVKVASLVDSVRAEGLPVVLLDAGDAIQGNGLETVYQRGDRALPDPMMRAMSAMKYDAMAVGNHEFDLGLAPLEKARAAANFPWLAANVVRASDGRPAFGASLVTVAGPLRVGIIGITTPAVPSMIDSLRLAGLRFLPPVEVARAEAKRLREQEHCDVVVILAHTGLERSRGGREGPEWIDGPGDPAENWGYRLATEVPGVDVVLLGHTHVVIASETIGGVTVAEAGKNGERLGRVDLTLTRDAAGAAWRVTARRSRMITVTDATPENPEIARLAEPYDRATREGLARVVGRTARAIEARNGRYADNTAIELIHRAQLEASGADVSLASLADATVRIPSGPVTERDLLRLYPFDNTLAVVELAGAALDSLLERSAASLLGYTFEAERALADPAVPGWQFDSAERIDYTIDLTRPAGDRVSNLTFQGQPLDPAHRLKVVVNSYRAGGLGGFDALRVAPRVWTTQKEVRELLRETLSKDSTFDPVVSRNWTVLPDYAPLPERPLIDLLVRQKVMTRDEAMKIRADAAGLRGDLAYWLARAFRWRERRASDAFVDVPDSLAPWLDALVRRKVIGRDAQNDRFAPHDRISVSVATEWCERAARSALYALAPKNDPAFRAGLLAGTSRGTVPGWSDTLTRAQLLAIVANTRYPTIRVLETTDFHGAILGGARRSGRALGGSPVLAAHLARLRAENPQGTVLIDGGDCFQGTMISNLQFGRPVVEQMNALRYDAWAVGNHEFDWTADTLQNRVREATFPALGANMVARKTGKLPPWVLSDTTVTRRGVRVGILGMCYRGTPSVTLAAHVAHLRFEDDSVAAVRVAPRLDRTSDVVVGVGHVPAESDSTRRALSGDLVRLARGIAGVDAWFGGHSHNQVLDRVAGKPVIIPGSHGEIIGVCDLVIDPIANQVIESRIRLVSTFADEVTPDSAMQARVLRWNAGIAPIASKEVGRNARRLTRNRGGESTVGDLVADAIRAASGADIAFQNSGGLRADLPEGPITRGTIYEVMPFDNLVVTMDLTGAEVKLALEQGLKVGRIAQVSGIRFTFDSKRPEMDRIVTLTDSAGTALDPAKTYRVACNDFMATGGDDFNALAAGRNVKQTGTLVRDALETYVTERSLPTGALDFRPDGRIQRVQ